MSDSHEGGRVLKLALFVGLAAKSPAGDSLLRSLASRSPRGFGDGDGAVGLGIVAAMSGSSEVGVARAVRPPARSHPIPIVPARPAVEPRQTKAGEDEREMSESYTCVISHVGGGLVRKRVYFDNGSEVVGRKCRESSGVFVESSPAEPPPVAEEFLSRCNLCRKKLSGLDIFMYRGDRAFCSVECRCQQIWNDEHVQECGSEAQNSNYSESPHSVSHLFKPGIAAT